MADNSKMELIGYKLLVQDHPAFVSQMRSANQAAEKFIGTMERGTKKPLELVSDSALKRVDALRDRMTNITQKALAYRGGMLGAAAQTDGFKNMLASLNPTAMVAAAGLAVLTVGAIKLGQTFLSLGKRGAVADGVIFAFSRIAAVTGTTSDALLGDMRRAAAGTVADLDLMRRANLALAGAQGETAKQLAQSLPKLLEIARAQAKATGQDVNYLFESLVTGVKRSAPLLIDNTGIVLKVGSANEKLAQSLGKSVDALTDEEKQIAVLNATLEAGQRAVDLYGSKQRTAAELISSYQVRITNFMDRLAVSIQPAYTLLLEVGDALMASIVSPIQNFVLPLIYELTKAFFGPLLNAWRSFKEGIEQTAAPALDLLRRTMIPVVATIRLVGVAWKWLLEQTGKILKLVLEVIKAFVERVLGKEFDPQKFFEGGARMIGALAAGILHAANYFVFPAVILIAQTIADFLCGFSPPPKGPLSAIDKGGENTMLAWLEGFTGVSLDSVEGVAAQVNETLGSIAGLGLEQVEARIAVLDAAIQPFEERLKIIEGRMNAILNPLKQIEGVLNRRLDTALGAFFGGKADAESVRALDRQQESLQARMDSVQAISDEAAYQLSLKQLEQVGERNLLEIQLARLKALGQEEVVAEKIEKLKEQAAEKAAAGGAGEDVAAAVPGGLGDLSLPDDPIAAFLGLDEEAVKASMAGITGALVEGFEAYGGPGALKQAQQNIGTLAEQLLRIDQADAGSKLKNKFTNLFGLGPDGLVADVVKWGTSLHTEIVKTFNSIDDIPVLGGFVERFRKNLASGGPIGIVVTSFVVLVTGLLGSGGRLSGILDAFSLAAFGDKWTEMFDKPGFGIRQTLDNFLLKLVGFVMPGTGNIMSSLSSLDLNPFGDKWTEMFDKPGFGIRQTLDNFLLKLVQFVMPDSGNIMSSLSSLDLNPFGVKWTDMFDNPKVGIVLALNRFMALLSSIFSEEGFIVRVFSGVGKLIDHFLVQPVKKGLNTMLGVFESALNAIVDAVNNFTQSGVMGAFTNLTGELGIGDAKIDHVHIPRLRAGALAAQGMMQLHRDELVMARQPVTVFPQTLSRQIMSAIQGPRAAQRMVAGPSTVNNSTSNQTSNNVTNNFRVYGQQSLRLAMAQAKGWG